MLLAPTPASQRPVQRRRFDTMTLQQLPQA
jgi:hypothetical protein